MYQEYKYSQGHLHHPEWMIRTESQKDGVGRSYFFTEKEAELKYYEWKKWGGINAPVRVKTLPPIPCTEALQKILEDGKVYTEGLFFCIQNGIADVHPCPVILNRNGTHFHSILKDKTISAEWHELWHEIEAWYGDIHKKESAEKFIHRIQRTFSLSINKK